MTTTQNPNFAAIDAVVAQAATAADFWADSTATQRATLLRGLADALEQQQAELVAIADRESGLGEARLNGEVARTAFQLRGFASEVEAGVPYRQVDDEAIAGAPPAGRPRLTRVQRPLGPVAMFSASNFPFAFSVLGGDTASALAAGCPVVIKPHSGHPELSRAVFALAAGVVRAQGLPAGLLTLAEAPNRAAGTYLVQHPSIAAVAFTGSYQGGKALWLAANDRERPVPFFGELGSINPLVALPAVLEKDSEALARTLAGSITVGCGQFCTSPGVIVLLDSPHSQRFVAQLAEAIAPIATHRMLTPGMQEGFEAAAATVAANATAVFAPQADGAGPAPRLFASDAASFIANAHLREEMFGPAALIVTARSVAQAAEVLEAIGGTLTTTLWGLDADNADNRQLLRAAQRVSGRVLFSGVPTGVAVCHAQQHGGPWPSSTAPQSTSVGYAAIERFLRPVALQDAPAWVLG
ncbi:aldehyde dehydrogenase (NADP(+)) [Pseudomonas monteilii]|uniref:Alpha-ketoglutarate semialdehyde dehydrogenase n=1 Tax=Pseudomonas monteilii TaxID=76759 RepID=A0AAE6RB24_9PSED|nr:aldehyde dehydrogenase (NADP(+)) [Pseudomonas monteilii]NBB04659.1 aldehyde dehydrogenase family protein [Pseudomonas monteilii]QHB27686.1 alpha-ketoglutarate semialdehyde dehydrogenase [Pseudomonas monteilii]